MVNAGSGLAVLHGNGLSKMPENQLSSRSLVARTNEGWTYNASSK